MSVTKNITIFDPLKTKTVTKEERDEIYSKLQEETGINPVYFEALKGLELWLLKKKTIMSNIPSVMLKNIVENTGLITKKRTEKRYFTTIQVKKPIQLFDKFFEKTQIASSEQSVDVIGVIFDSSREYTTSLDNKPTEMSHKKMVINGLYHPEDYVGDYTQDKSFIKLRKKRLTVSFNNKDQALRMIKMLIEYMKYKRFFYGSSVYFYNTFSKNERNKISLSNKPHVQEKKRKKEALVEFLNSIYVGTLSTTNRQSTLSDIMSGGMWDIYASAKVNGVGSSETKDLVNAYVKKQNTKARHNQDQKNKIHQQTSIYLKMSIAKKTFGKSTAELNKKEKDIVETIYKKNNQLDEEVMNNRCVHLKWLRQVMYNHTLGKHFNSHAWSQLKKMIPLTNDNVLQCNLCKIQSLCPHYYDLFEAEMNKMSSYEINKLLIEKYSGGVHMEGTFYCNLCGEKIAKRLDEGIEWGDITTPLQVSEYFKRKLWKDVRNIISKHVVFKILINKNNLISNITEIVYPFLAEEKKKLVSTKTKSEETIKKTIELYTNIYTLVSLVRIISHNPKDIQFKNVFKKKKGGSGMVADSVFSRATPKPVNTNKKKVNIKMLQKLFRIALYIMSKKEDIINNVPGISPSAVKPLFIQAYKKISKLYISVDTIKKTIPSAFVVNNPVYNYIHHIKNKLNPSLKYTDIKRILGISLEEVSKVSDLFENVKIPSPPPNPEIHKKYVFDSLRQHSKIHKKYVFDSFSHFMRFVKEKIYLLDLGSSMKYKKHVEEYNEIKKVEDSITSQIINYYAVNRREKNVEQYGSFNSSDAHLGHIYCEDGERHSFDVMVFSDGKSTTSVPSKKTQEWMFDPNNKKFKNIDSKCSNCGKLMSQVESTDEKKIKKSIKMKNNLEAFYNMYYTKCPVKKIHVRPDGKKCKQCGITKEIINSKDVAFYNKYKNKFLKDKETPININITRKKIKDEKKTIEKEHSLSDDLESIKTLANLIGVSVNSILSIGLSEGVAYDDILSEKTTPYIDADDETYSYQVQQIMSYSNSVRVNYEKFKNSKLDFNFSKNIDYSRFPEMKGPVRYVHDSKKMEASYALGMFAKQLLKIYQSFAEEDYKKAAKKFISYSIHNIINYEKSISEPGIIQGVFLNDEDAQYDAVEDGEIEDSFKDDTFDPFKMDMDADIQMNSMPNSGD